MFIVLEVDGQMGLSDIVLVSYDHLDIYTIAKLVKLDTAKCTLYFVPLGRVSTMNRSQLIRLWS